jgi:hypothetical protein
MEDNSQFSVKEPTAAYGINSYADVMYFLHTMRISPEVKEQVGHRLVLEVTAKNLAKAYARLDHLAELEEDWDGEGALPISRQVLNNIKSVLLISGDEDWKEWMIGPEPNATLGLQSKATDACISIGAEEYSYYGEIKGKEYHGNHVAFTPSAFLETMREIG